MKTAEEEINELRNMQVSWQHKESEQIYILAKHIDAIEKTLRYLVDQKVEEKYGKQ